MESIKNKKENIDIVEIISRYINLKRRGTKWVGLCPIHTEKTPSFHVDAKRQAYKCFGCGKSGDVINFIQEVENISFVEAIKKLKIDTKFDKSKSNFQRPIPPPRKLHFIDPKYLKQSLKKYEDNRFVNFLLTLFAADLVTRLITKMYYIGTSKSIWEGTTVFWQVDHNLQVRQAKGILYNPVTGKRRKWKRQSDHEILKTAKENWIAKNKVDAVCFGKRLIKKSGVAEPSIIPCFFGQHLVKDNQKIAIVESEKTAVLMAGFGAIGLPIARDFTWLATGGATGINFNNKDAFKVLEGKEVVLFPDLEKFKEWTYNSLLLENVNVVVSDLLEGLATEADRKAGLDIADFILKEYQKGQHYQSTEKPTATKSNVLTIPKVLSKSEQVFQMMKTKNPIIMDLMKSFGISQYDMTVSSMTEKDNLVYESQLPVRKNKKHNKNA